MLNSGRGSFVLPQTHKTALNIKYYIKRTLFPCPKSSIQELGMPLQPAFDLVSFNCNRLGLHWFSSEKLGAGRCQVLELLCEQTEDAKS